jgi:diguanylate cyclase (GGDEF)-like protein
VACCEPRDGARRPRDRRERLLGRLRGAGRDGSGAVEGVRREDARRERADEDDGATGRGHGTAAEVRHASTRRQVACPVGAGAPFPRLRSWATVPENGRSGHALDRGTATMTSGDRMEVGDAGGAARDRAPRARAVVAIALACATPVAALAAVVALGLPREGGWPLALLGVAALGALAGAAGIWDLGRRASGTGTPFADALLRLLATVERQTLEIQRLAGQLDAANQELEQASLQLRELSFRDEVTGLYNRRFFALRLEEELSRFRRFEHPLSVVLVDLDGFKAVNDSCGHAVGDETLREIAQVLVADSRGINVVARYGGDEFAILLVETPKQGALLFAERMRQALAARRFSHGYRITASFGIVALPDDGVPSSDALLRVADEALYAAKRGGKNQVRAVEAGAPTTT